MDDAPRGYRTIIHPGLWKVIVSKIGIPKKWVSILMMCALMQTLGGMRLTNSWWGLLAGGLCSAIETGLLIWITQVDIQFDDIHRARWLHRYREYYDA